MNTFAQLQETRNKLMIDATALARTKDINVEQKAQVMKMLADVDVLEDELRTAKRLEDFAAEQRRATAPPRGEVSTHTMDEARSAMRAFLLNGERRELGTVTSGAMTGGSQLIAPAFYPI